MFLKSVFKSVYGYINEKKFDLIFQHSNLENWAKQGICLINNCLTISKTKKEDHKAIWMEFMNDVYREIAKEHDFLAVLIYGQTNFYLEELFYKKYHAVWKIPKEDLETNDAFGKAYEWYDRTLYDVVNNGLTDESYFNLIPKRFNYKDALDMDKFMNLLKKCILDNQIPYPDGRKEIQQWREMSQELFQWDWRVLFDLTLTK